jgi:hypothetical protein
MSTEIKTFAPSAATELYVYLGQTSSVMVFVCLARQATTPLALISYDLYNFLIQETMIARDANVVVYALVQDTRKVHIAQTWYKDFKRAVFPPGTLVDLFSRFVTEPPPR